VRGKLVHAIRDPNKLHLFGLITARVNDMGLTRNISTKIAGQSNVKAGGLNISQIAWIEEDSSRFDLTANVAVG
jgi:hypothetical protein